MAATFSFLLSPCSCQPFKFSRLRTANIRRCLPDKKWRHTWGTLPVYLADGMAPNPGASDK
jgi:hypothetical protein